VSLKGFDHLRAVLSRLNDEIKKKTDRLMHWVRLRDLETWRLGDSETQRLWDGIVAPSWLNLNLLSLASKTTPTDDSNTSSACDFKHWIQNTSVIEKPNSYFSLAIISLSDI
jgi:hypothetical protein